MNFLPDKIKKKGPTIPSNRVIGSGLEEKFAGTHTTVSDTATISDKAAFIFSETKEGIGKAAKKFYELVNDPDLLPPFGKYLIGNPSKIYEHFIETGNLKGAFKVIALTAAILTSLPGESVAEGGHVQKNAKEIEWLLEAMKGVDPINYVLYQKEAKKSRDAKSTINLSEINILTWNLYHEARGKSEGGAGRNAVLLTSINRMLSAGYPETAEGVVLGKYQHSWTLKIEELNSRKPEVGVFLEIRRDLNKYEGLGVGEIKMKVTELLLASNPDLKGKEGVLDKITSYHKLGMLDNPVFLKEVKTFDTFKRIIYLETMFGKDPNIFKIGSHIFYGDILIPPDIEVPEKYAAQYAKLKTEAEAKKNKK